MFSRASLLVLVFPLAVHAQPSSLSTTSCSTFRVRGPSSQLVGHNLDEVFHTPGWLIVSPRGVTRRDVCGHELLGEQCPTPDLRWTARYGSVAFGFSADLADGGMNEAGLTINEMGLEETRHPFHPGRPTLLTRLWIRYQLDMFATVEEVVAHLDSINIDGNNLYAPFAVTRSHYFVTDARGRLAIIEFVDSGVVVHTDADADVPVLCNTRYAVERKRLRSYWRFGGWQPIFETFLTGYPRFVRGAYLVTEYEERSREENVRVAFGMLSSMQMPGTRQWSIVYDIEHRTVLFRTVKGPSIRWLELDRFSFRPGEPIRILPDIHVDLEGDVITSLVDWTPALQKRFLEGLIRNYAEWVTTANGGTDVDVFLSNGEPGLTLDAFMQRAVRGAAMVRP